MSATAARHLSVSAPVRRQIEREQRAAGPHGRTGRRVFLIAAGIVGMAALLAAGAGAAVAALLVTVV